MSELPNPSQPDSPHLEHTERRYFPRWIVENKVLYRLPHQTSYREATTKDLSGDGACLLCQEDLKAAQENLKAPLKLTLVVYLADDIAVEVTGYVMWNEFSGQRALLGVRFENTSTKVQDMILQYAFECNKELLTKNWFKGWT